jgi:hypothetical protein
MRKGLIALQILIAMIERNFRMQLKLLAFTAPPENDSQEPEIRSFCRILSIDVLLQVKNHLLYAKR